MCIRDRRNVYQAEADYANARYSYIVSFLTLRQAAGQLSEADVIEINGWLDKPRATDGSSKEEPAKGPDKEPAKPAANKDKANGKSAKVADKATKTPAPPSPDKATPSYPVSKPPSAAPK